MTMSDDWKKIYLRKKLQKNDTPRFSFSRDFDARNANTIRAVFKFLSRRVVERHVFNMIFQHAYEEL
jgi:hypothetical protein